MLVKDSNRELYEDNNPQNAQYRSSNIINREQACRIRQWEIFPKTYSFNIKRKTISRTTEILENEFFTSLSSHPELLARSISLQKSIKMTRAALIPTAKYSKYVDVLHLFFRSIKVQLFH